MNQPSNTEKSSRCIVLPFQPKSDEGPNRIGTALHFLLGNVIVMQSDLKECWFGWRVKSLFADASELRHYCTGISTLRSMKAISIQQKVRFWVYGRYAANRIEMKLFDLHNPEQACLKDMPFSSSDDLVGFRKAFIDWFGKYGIAFKENQKQMSLWPEKISMRGLNVLGEALEEFYCYSAFGSDSELKLGLFEKAVLQAPESYMANDLLGWAFYRNQDYKKAMMSFLKALNVNPNGAGVMAGLMWCGIHTQNLEDALYWGARKADVCQKDIKEARQMVLRRFEKATANSDPS